MPTTPSLKLVLRRIWDVVNPDDFNTHPPHTALYVKAASELHFVQPDGGAILHHVSSPGLYGIDTASTPDYIAECLAEERQTLTAMLLAIGIDQEQINIAMSKRSNHG
jgi:hypothetical protein